MREPEKQLTDNVQQRYYLTREEINEMLRDVRAKLAQASEAWDREHSKKKV